MEDSNIQMVDACIAPEQSEESDRCLHETFVADVQCIRQVETIWPHLVKALAVIRVRCAKCGMPFVFKGMPMSKNNSNGTSPDLQACVLNLIPTKAF